MRIVFWISLLGILYAYAGYPAAIWLLARLRPRPWRTSPITPSVSIVLAVHNGASLLAHKLRRLLRADYPNLREILVVSDGSSDGTEQLLARPCDPRLKPIVLPRQEGKAVALNAGMAAATGEIILFLDIRPELTLGAIRQLMSNFADPAVGCVSGRLKVRCDGHDAAASAVGGLYWRYEQWTRECEARYQSPVGVYGGFYAVRRELAVPQPAGIILDDMFQPLSILRGGHRVVLDAEARVYDIWPKHARGEFDRKVRTLAGNFQLLQLAPWLLTPQNPVLFQFFSHKLLRLVAPYFWMLLLIAAWALASRSALYAGFAAMLTGGLLLALAGLRFRVPGLHRVAAPASALLLLNLAAIAGLYRFLFTAGPLWKIWKTGSPVPPASPPAIAPAQAAEFDESLYPRPGQPQEAEEHVAML